MTNFKKTLISIFFVFVTNTAFTLENVHYIDMDSIMNDSLAGKTIIKQLENKNKLITESFKKIEEKLKNEETKLVSQKNILEKNDFDEKVNLFQKKILKYKKERQDTLSKFSSQKNDAQKILIEKLMPILATYSEENSISIILPKQNIIIGKSDLDLTNIIIEILNAEMKSIKLN